ncbi:MAG: alpha/beta hydrolase [Pseudomonadota bacterium]
MPFLNLSSCGLWYRRAGAGPSIVFLHAASGSSEHWECQLDFFSEAGFDCLSYDRVGWGLSSAITASSGAASDNLDEFIRALRLGAVHLVAIAAGGAVALDFALSYPESVASLTVACSVGGVQDAEFLEQRARFWTPELLARPVHERELGQHYQNHDPVGAAAWQAIAERAHAEENHARDDLIKQSLTLEKLSGIQSPVLLIAGSQDLLAPPELMGHIASAIPHCRFVTIDHAGHAAFWEAPDRVNGLLLDFLRDNP